ncbi:hypothetical protein HOLleu_06871 [Holothuria leucospilota]|uniref:Uncharacterized protein n=1 Tax=Holothuria leucospilota TaxID=206669 RepID=A0A9Q1CMS4_HOLLE|nr:hypothetical protein HOLleu_06871 [Holothuria leucospilota]
MAVQILTTIVILLFVNSAVSLIDFSNIGNSGFTIKGKFSVLKIYRVSKSTVHTEIKFSNKL